MPYISANRREDIDSPLRDANESIETVGDLTFALTQLVVRWIARDLSYSQQAAALGALEATKLEIARRVLAPYEDEKRLQNGDVIAVGSLLRQHPFIQEPKHKGPFLVSREKEQTYSG